MKTNFENAVKILMEGRCEAIRQENCTCEYILCKGALVYKKNELQGVLRDAEDFLDQWECLGYKPEMETVEVKRWAVIDRTGAIGTYACAGTAHENARESIVVELSGTYQRPIKEKVKRRVEVDANTWPVRTLDGHRLKPEAKFYAEWPE